MSIAKPIHILLYEDNIGYRDSFKLAAQKHRIITDTFDNVDSLIEALEENPRKHKFVVLDARAYLHEGQGQGTEDEFNLIKIFNEIDRIGKEQDRVIAYCINTGFSELKLRFQEVLKCEIFEKGQEDNLFQFIWNSYNNTDAAKLRMDYPEVFDFVDTYFDNADMEVLSSLLHNKKYEAKGISDRVENLSNLRRLVEHVMDIIYNQFPGQMQGIINNKATRASDIIHYLKNNEGMPPQVYGAAVQILRTASSFGSHTPEKASEITDYPSDKSIISLTYGFFELIGWVKKLAR